MDYPDTTLYRSPTDDDIAKRRAAAAGSSDFNTGPYAFPSPMPLYRTIARSFARGADPATPAEQAARVAAGKAAKKQYDIGEDTGITGAKFPVLPPPLPGADKAAGEAAIASGTPGELNYGPGARIFGSGRGSKGQLNSFSGYGTGAATTENPAPQPYEFNTGFAAARAGTTGMMSSSPAASAAPDPLTALRARIADMQSQADALTNNGTLKGRVQGSVLARRAAALLNTQLGTEANLAHSKVMSELGMQQLLQQGQHHAGTLGLGYQQLQALKTHQAGTLSLDTAKSTPLLQAHAAIQKLANAGDLKGAAAASSVLLHGTNPYKAHVVPTIAGTQIVYDENGRPIRTVDQMGNPTDYPDAAFPPFAPPTKR